MDRGAFVACGSAGRGFRSASESSGWSFSAGLGADVMSPTPEGVGVNGGGLVGDSDAVFRFFGRGVAGRLGTANVESAVGDEDVDLGKGRALDFLVVAGRDGFFGPFESVVIGSVS